MPEQICYTTVVKRNKYATIASLAVSICVLAVAAPTLATPVEGITLTPAGINQVVEPGSLNTGSFQVLNEGSTGYDFHIFVKPYHVNGEDYTPDFTLLPGTTDISDWFQFTVLRDHIDPGQSVDIGYKIVVPPAATPGGYYAVAFAETQQQHAPNSILINERVGELFYIQVAGPATEKSSIASWQVAGRQAPPLLSTLRLENAGTTHYYADTQINVRDILGRIKYSYKSHNVILPRTIRKISMVWDKAPPIGLFKVDGNVDFLGNKHPLPGHYVLVMSDTARKVTIGIFILLVLLAMVPIIRRNRRILLKRRKLKL
jgi:hypothetical protein